MATRLDFYRIRDNKTPLSASELNRRFFDIDSRISDIERIEDQLAEEVSNFQQLGLTRIAEIVDPVVASAQQLIEDANDLINAASNIASVSDVDARTSWNDGATLSYDGSGRIDTITEVIGGESKVVTMSYDENDRVSSVQTDWDGVRRTETFSYNVDDTISEVAVTEVAL